MVNLRGIGHFARRALGLGESGSWLGVHPAEDATRANVVAYAFTTWCTVLCFVFVNAAQPGILRKILPAAGQNSASAHGGGGMQDAGNASGSIVLWAEITVILLSPIWGALADRMGGRFVNVSGFIFAAVGLAVIPSCGSIEALTAARCLFSVGGAALGSTLSSILAHTVLQADKGKGAALAGTAASFGAIFAALCLLRIPAIAEQMAAAGAPGGIGVPGASYVHCAYYTAACFAMFGAAVGAWHLYDKKMEGAAPAAPAECDGHGMQKEQREGGLVLRLSEVSNVSLSRARECIAILRADAGMCLALAAALQARGDASTVTVFLALWVNEYSKDVNGVSGAQAARAAGAATGLVYTLSLLSGPPWGIVVDRLGDARSLMLAAAISGVTYSGMSLLSSPTSGLGYLFGAGMGVAEIAMNISSQSMIARRSPPGARGMIGGMASVASGVGILFTGKLGGLAYDVSPGGPFLVQGILSFAVCAAAAMLHARGKLGMPKHRAEEESRGDEGQGECGGGGGGMAALDSLNVDVPCDGDEPRDVEQQGGGGRSQDAEGGGYEHDVGVAKGGMGADKERIIEEDSKGGANQENRGKGRTEEAGGQGREGQGIIAV